MLRFLKVTCVSLFYTSQ